MALRDVTPRRRQRDMLPEKQNWRDDGCDVSRRCVECPLSMCRYDHPRGLRGLLNEERNADIVAMMRARIPPDLVASRYGVSRRTVFRVVRRAVAA